MIISFIDYEIMNKVWDAKNGKNQQNLLFLAANQKTNLLDKLLCIKLNCPYCCCGLTNGFGLLELDNGEDGLLAPIE